jgi:replicative DNA helicase
MLDESQFRAVLDIIEDSAAFYKLAHGMIFDAILALHHRQDPVEMRTVAEQLKASAQLEEVGGPLYLAELCEGLPSAANVLHYARAVREKSLLRNVIAIGSDVARAAYTPGAKPEAIAADVLTRIREIQTVSIQGNLISQKEASHRTYEDLMRRHLGSPADAIYSGFPQMDSFIGEFEPGQLYVLGARPSNGKTALAMNIAKRQAQRGKRIFVQSLEMPVEQITQRLVADETNIPLNRLRQRNEALWKSEQEKILRAFDELQDLPILYDDRPGSIEKVCAASERAVRDGGAQLLILDHLALIQRSKGYVKGYEHITLCSNHLKALAKELNCPLLCLAQLNRSSEGRDTHPRPQLSDLRDSEAIEQDADVVMLIYRPELYTKRLKESDKTVTIYGQPRSIAGMAEVIVAKNRQGDTGSFWLNFERQFTRFTSIGADSIPAPAAHSYPPESEEDTEDLPF